MGAAYVRRLAEDEPELVDSEVSDALAPWTQTPPVLQYLARYARIQAALYQGDADGAAKHLSSRRFDPLARLAFQHLRIYDAWFEGRVALARGRVLQAGVELASGRPDVAAQSARMAQEVFTGQAMVLHARCASAWSAHIESDTSGRDRALTRVARLGVRDPLSYLRVLTPYGDVPAA